jgi:uncharacterized membrane protein YphA (DoxX/SURF4 family)
MTTNVSPVQKVTVESTGCPNERFFAANGLAVVRLTIGAMLVWVFFENLGKGLYTPAGYAGPINHYIKASHSPAAWKAVMAMAASHAALAAPMQAVREISLGILLVLGLLTRPAAFVAFVYLGVRMGQGVDLGTPGSGPGLACTRAGTRWSNLGY